MNLASFSVHKMSASHLPFLPGLLIIRNYRSVTLALQITLEQLAECILEAVWVGSDLTHRAHCLFVLYSPLRTRRKGTDVAGIQTAASPAVPKALLALLNPSALCSGADSAAQRPRLPAPAPQNTFRKKACFEKLSGFVSL